ncbi:hypothetical protein SPSYN_00914 [Sporotomaculum syntrophicum]|uniref:MazG nucleotide pyrophosphohydrolase domain protein n=1 Tax=Sporotomaculum syntrophicum TaxID=182264 RepID=A0A9D3AZS8_9FIRM|nr:nucleotide pyrophosphohydrolase [Sporotomaculum syntrophicum]KAF1086173.1 hypothetical protein SPSYN_00914 [Sporotomaculum syntrophicum]
MSDITTNIQQLKDLVAAFVEERSWNQFIRPKNLSMSIAIEAAELMELLQWTDGTDTADIPDERVREELADVVIYCLSLANSTGIDLSTAIREKVVANAKKYPVNRYMGDININKTCHYMQETRPDLKKMFYVFRFHVVC